MDIYAGILSTCGASQVSAYVACPDITLTVTPDLKLPGTGRLVHVDLTAGRRRLGGSALAHAYGQVCLPSQMRILLHSLIDAKAS